VIDEEFDEDDSPARSGVFERLLPDRRGTPRVRFRGEGELASASGTFSVRGIDLSETGTALRIQGVVEPGERVELSLSIDSGEFEAPAEVLRVESGRLALRFLTALPDTVRAWLRRRASDD
jgi:hypothetical protein